MSHYTMDTYMIALRVVAVSISLLAGIVAAWGLSRVFRGVSRFDRFVFFSSIVLLHVAVGYVCWTYDFRESYRNANLPLWLFAATTAISIQSRVSWLITRIRYPLVRSLVWLMVFALLCMLALAFYLVLLGFSLYAIEPFSRFGVR